MPSLHELNTGPRIEDRREHWIDFTQRLTRSTSIDEIARELAGYVAAELGATSVGVYLIGARIGAREPVYRLIAQVGGAHFARIIDQATALASWLLQPQTPTYLPLHLLSSVVTPALPGTLVVGLRWRSIPLGFVVLGPSRDVSGYSAGEMQILVTMGDQAAASIMATRMSEAAAKPRALETVDRVKATAIHDLKNSVSALSLLSRNAASNFSDPEFQRDAMVSISRTVERMRRVLATLSSPERTTPPHPEPIDLHDLVIEATAPLMANPGIRLVRRLRRVPTVYGNREALLRVVENLATNAAEAISDDGMVTVTLAEEQGHIIMSVADTGCGITEEFRARHLFSPFRTTKKDGWGIGLYQAKQAIESERGEILVESTVGRGTTFTVRLPVQADLEHFSLESVR